MSDLYFSSEVTARARAQGERDSHDQAVDSTAPCNRMTAHGSWRPVANGVNVCFVWGSVVIKSRDELRPARQGIGSG
jgi:hypothetical protein